MNINDYIKQPIPREEDLPEMKSYRDFPINLDDERSKEPLVNCLDMGFEGLSFYHRNDGYNAPYHIKLKGTEETIRLREGVAKKLQNINKKLSKIDLELFMLDGYRTIECQQGIYDWMKEQTIKMMPDASEEEVLKSLKNFISDPSNFDKDDPKTWTSHVTGAAIDLTLRHKSTKEMLYMGGVFDDPSIISFSSYYEAPTDDSKKHPEHQSASHSEARKNRRLLFWLMHEEGFSNLPTEWWHFDYGNQLWSKNRKYQEADFKEVAYYGPAEA